MQATTSSMLPKNSPIYVIDFLNLFSDYREIFYKEKNIDFHLLKHKMLEKDTFDFFKMFFTKYINYTKISKESEYIFILKKITNYNVVLYKIVELYKDIKIKFIIIETKFTSNLLDKNKDDFFCQYLFCILLDKNKNVMLITNDKYRDSINYVNLFDKKCTKLKNIAYKKVSFTDLEINKYGLSLINNEKYIRVGIPKEKLKFVI